LGELCSQLLKLGCAYLSTWGPDCERVHDIMDKVADAESNITSGVVMTTWHDDESLSEALWYFLNCTHPDEEYAPKGCDLGLVVVVASKEWTAEIELRMGATGR